MVLAPAMVLLTVIVLTTLPMWMLLAAALSPFLPGRLRALRVLWVIVVALVLESVALVALLGLWLAAGFGLAICTPPFQYLHYQLVGWYLQVLYREAARVLRLRVDIEGPGPDDYPDRPLLVFCRHAGPGDSFLLVHALVNWYAREPRIVLSEALQWDPGLDVVLNRLPNRFLPAGGPRHRPNGGVRLLGRPARGRLGPSAAAIRLSRIVTVPRHRGRPTRWSKWTPLPSASAPP